MNSGRDVSDGYEDFQLRWSWGGCSLVLFAAIVLFLVALPFLIQNVARLRWFRVAVLFLPTASLIGTVAGAIGLRSAVRSPLATLGLVLNGTILACCAAAVVYSLVR